MIIIIRNIIMDINNISNIKIIIIIVVVSIKNDFN